MQVASGPPTTQSPPHELIDQAHSVNSSQESQDNSSSDILTLEMFPAWDSVSGSLIPSTPSSRESVRKESDLCFVQVTSDDSDGLSGRSALYGSSASSNSSGWVNVGDVHSSSDSGVRSISSIDLSALSSTTENPLQEETWAYIQDQQRLVDTKPDQDSGAPSKKRRAFADDQRNKVNAVRQGGACIRCQMLHEPVATHFLFALLLCTSLNGEAVRR